MLLESMKKGVSKIVIQILALLLIASFAVWGIGDMTGTIGGANTVASVDGRDISQREFSEQFRREMDRIRQRIGQIDPQQARSLGLVESTINGMIARRLLAEQASDLGLLISDEQIVQRIQQQPGFQNALGQFDRSVFQNALANNGISESAYVASLRQDIQQDILSQAISGGVTAPPQLADTIYKYRNERRTAEIIRIKRPGVADAPTPTEAQLQKYLDENPDPFLAPEYRKVTLLYMDPEEVAKELSPDPQRIQEEYEFRLESLSVPERRNLEQILIRDEEEAQKAHAALSEGKSFDAVAKEFTDKSGDEIKLGLVAESDLLPDLANAAFAIDQGSFTAPTKSPLGWHIIRVSEIQPGRKPALAEVEKEISADVARELALDDLVKRANKIEDALAGGALIDDAAGEAGAKIRVVGPIDPSAKLQAGTPVSGLPQDTRFIEAVFSLEKGATSPLTETDGGGYFMVRVDEIISSAKRPLSEVRDAVENAWKLEQLDSVAQKIAEDVRDAAKAGASLTQIAADRKLVREAGTPFTRFSTAGETIIPRSLLPGLFEANTNDVVMAQTVDGFAVARLTAIEEASPASGSEDLERLKQTLAGAFATDLLQEYTRALRGEYDVSINRAGIDAYFANQQY